MYYSQHWDSFFLKTNRSDLSEACSCFHQAIRNNTTRLIRHYFMYIKSSLYVIDFQEDQKLYLKNSMAIMSKFLLI